MNFHLDDVVVPTLATITKILCRLGPIAHETVANVFLLQIVWLAFSCCLVVGYVLSCQLSPRLRSKRWKRAMAVVIQRWLPLYILMIDWRPVLLSGSPIFYIAVAFSGPFMRLELLWSFKPFVGREPMFARVDE